MLGQHRFAYEFLYAAYAHVTKNPKTKKTDSNFMNADKRSYVQ